MITALANLRPVPLLVLAVVVTVVLLVVQRRRHLPTGRLTLLGATLLAIGGVLVIALRVQLPIDPAGASHWEPDGPIRFVSDFAVSDEIRLNVLLLVPACLLTTIFTRRPFLVLLGGVVLTVLCECAQGVFRSGVPDGSDVLAGSLGALLGTLTGCIALLIRDRFRPSRQIILPTAVLAGLVVGLLALMPIAASNYATSYAADLRTRLTPISYRDVVDWGYGTAHVEDLTSKVWEAGRTRASANRYLPHEAQVLYPSSFMLTQQCVLATWTPTNLEVEQRSGQFCRSTWG